MNIIVCIKQVPGTSNVSVDPETGVLIRDGIESKLNPYDLYALELALCLRSENGGTVRVLTMGPPAATAVIREAIYMGADSGVLISDRRFAGADVLATSYTLSQAIKKMGDADLVLCGKQTTDGDTAQVGAETAEFLGIDHISNALSVTPADGGIECRFMLDNKTVTAAVKTPCLVCTDSEINVPRLPSYCRKCKTDGEEGLVTVLSLDDFDDRDPKHYGLAGSPTQVERIFAPEKNEDKTVLEGNDSELAGQLLEILKTKKFI